MSGKTGSLDKAFIDRQQQRLVRLRTELMEATRGSEADENDIRADLTGQAREYEDDAQRLAALELEGLLVVRNAQRLAQVERALEKIAAGTYGISDANAHAIPKERLEAIPEAST